MPICLWLTLDPGHEFRQLDAEPGARPARTAQHGGQLAVRVPARCRDVQVGPRLAAGKLADEHPTEYGPGLAVLRVAQVGDLAAKEDSVVGEDRQAPDSIARLASRAIDKLPETIVVADGGGGRVADRDRGGARQRGEIKDVRGPVSERVSQGIRQDQATLSI